jgi:hypothetical protein
LGGGGGGAAGSLPLSHTRGSPEAHPADSGDGGDGAAATVTAATAANVQGRWPDAPPPPIITWQ